MPENRRNHYNIVKPHLHDAIVVCLLLILKMTKEALLKGFQEIEVVVDFFVDIFIVF